MQKKRIVRFGKWLVKVAASYAAFIVIGMLLSLVPAGRLGLPEEQFFNFRMFFMLLGPIYLTLIVKIILTIIAAAKRRSKDVSEKAHGALFIVTGFLLLANLLGADTISDFADGYIHGKGMRVLEESKRYSLKGKRFLNVFVPVCFYLLMLELLTLIVCIVVFAPLSQPASYGFIFAIALTGMLLLIVPLILLLISGYQGDRHAHEKKRAQKKQEAELSGAVVLETDPALRKRYLVLPKVLALLVCPGTFIVCLAILAATKDAQALTAVRLLRQPVLAVMAAAMLSFVPLLMYWMNCSGTSLVQRIYIAQGQLHYTGYSGSMEERTEFDFTLLQLESCHVGKRSLRLRGQFDNKATKTLYIPRTFPPEQEQILMEFLRGETKKTG